MAALTVLTLTFNVKNKCILYVLHDVCDICIVFLEFIYSFSTKEHKGLKLHTFWRKTQNLTHFTLYIKF